MAYFDKDTDLKTFRDNLQMETFEQLLDTRAAIRDILLKYEAKVHFLDTSDKHDYIHALEAMRLCVSAVERRFAADENLDTNHDGVIDDEDFSAEELYRRNLLEEEKEKEERQEKEAKDLADQTFFSDTEGKL